MNVSDQGIGNQIVLGNVYNYFGGHLTGPPTPVMARFDG
jgi:hypothetical protein